MKALLRNLGLFFVVFLPVVALAGMTLGVLFPDEDTAPEWKLGWNPVLWFVMTAPWVVPAAVVVPALHFLGVWVARRSSARNGRAVVIAAAPVLLLAALVALWGSSYLTLQLGAPVCIGAVIYGVLVTRPMV